MSLYLDGNEAEQKLQGIRHTQFKLAIMNQVDPARHTLKGACSSFTSIPALQLAPPIPNPHPEQVSVMFLALRAHAITHATHSHLSRCQMMRMGITGIHRVPKLV